MAEEVIKIQSTINDHVRPVVQVLNTAVKEIKAAQSDPGVFNSAEPSGSTSREMSNQLRFITERLHSTVQDLRDVKIESEKLSRNQSLHRNVAEELDGFKSVVDVKFASLGRQPLARDVERELNDIKARQQVLVDQLNAGQRVHAPSTTVEDPRMGDMLETINDLKAQVYMLSRESEARSTSAETPSLSTNNQTLEVMRQMANEVASLRDQVSELRIENAQMRSELITDTVVFNGHFFLSDESYVLFVATHLSTGGYGFLMDFVSMLECAAEGNQPAQETLKNMRTLHNAGFDQEPNEGIVMASFSTLVPTLFGIEQDSKDHAKKMGSMTDMKEWDSNTIRSGRKNKIHTALLTLRRATDTKINAMFPPNSVPALFLREVNRTNFSFWESFTSWITQFENEMVSQMNADTSTAQKASIWNLICWLIHSMLTEMSSRRSPGRVARQVARSDTVGITTAILKGTLSCHKFMSELVEQNFNRHPLFAATMAEFLMTTKASVIVLEEVRATAKLALTSARASQSTSDKKIAGKKGFKAKAPEEDDD